MFDSSNLTSGELVRASWLRSVEWSKWPIFISQPLIPILLLFFPITKIAIALLITGYVWIFVRTHFVSFRLATLGCFLVRLKWPVMIGMGAYFGWHHNWKLSLLSLCSPLVVMILSALVPSTNILPLQHRMYAEVGFDPEATELNDLMDTMKLSVRD